MAGVDALGREQRIADLTIHGWEPFINRTTGRAGIWHEQLGVGFSVRDDSMREPVGDSSVKRLTRADRELSYEPCEWDRVTDWHLDAIDKRLAQT